jgi:hypothetical protein
VDNINEFNELSGLSLLGSVGEEVDVGEEVIDVDDKVSLKDKEDVDCGWSCHVHQIVYVWSCTCPFFN